MEALMQGFGGLKLENENRCEPRPSHCQRKIASQKEVSLVFSSFRKNLRHLSRSIYWARNEV